jgi:hypothetical protein
MARRLVAAGVRFVTVEYGGWDLHYQIASGMNSQMPPFDQAFSTLIRDLDRSGLLNRTVVMVSSEFGRSPKINAQAGRDHWPKVFSVVLAWRVRRGSSGESNRRPPSWERAIGPRGPGHHGHHLLGIVAERNRWHRGNAPSKLLP